MFIEDRMIFRARALFPNCHSNLYRIDDMLFLDVFLSSHEIDFTDIFTITFSIVSQCFYTSFEGNDFKKRTYLDLKTYAENLAAYYNV